MPAAYHRHTAGTASSAAGSGSRVAHRSGGGHGHVPSWSTSSNEGLGANPMSFTTAEDEVANLASTATSLLDNSYDKQHGRSWASLARRVR